MSASPQPSPISTFNSGDLSLLENPKILASAELIPGLDEISSLHRVAQNVQQSVPTFRKLRWASTDKPSVRSYMMPLNVPIPGISRMKSPNSSFDIPFNIPDIRRNSDFIGREDLLEQPKQEIEKHTNSKENIIKRWS
ncbi:hypothetical protein BDZ91DRAFT_801513 [Kalaharituber pfeilii]|nr:hypothetical protein BDZ91DRAFT_801513 [Kalaharituber pfeilii]